MSYVVTVDTNSGLGAGKNFGPRFATQTPNTALQVKLVMTDKTNKVLDEQSIGRFVVCWNEELKDPQEVFTEKLFLLLGMHTSVQAALQRLCEKTCGKSASLAVTELKQELAIMLRDCSMFRKDLFKFDVKNDGFDRDRFIKQFKKRLLAERDWLHVDGKRDVTFKLTAEVKAVEIEKKEPPEVNIKTWRL
jgi:hypothetical protein